MLLRITLVLEIFAVIVCIHAIYGEKVHLDLSVIALFLIMLSVLEIVNNLNLENSSSMILYIPIWIYCKIKFRENVIHTTIHLVLFLSIFIIVQFLAVLLVNIVLPQDEIWRTFVTNMFTLLICLFVLPEMNVSKVLKFVKRYAHITYIVVGLAFLILAVLLFQNKIAEGIRAEYFVFTIPAIALLLFMIVKWGNARSKAENLEKEKQLTLAESKKYDELLAQVRLRQHEFKNHITAIFSAHYAYDTYENLTKARQEYYDRIKEENRYDGLLLIGNRIISGFLYGKFREMEEDGLQIWFKAAAQFINYEIPAHKLIEMLGILLDNAAEAVKEENSEGKAVFVSVEEEGQSYCFKVKNKSRYVSYSEMESWFGFGQSGKGKNRGIGLYHLKMLCEEWNCGILCRNAGEKEQNEIEFVLRIPKADKAVK